MRLVLSSTLDLPEPPVDREAKHVRSDERRSTGTDREGPEWDLSAASEAYGGTHQEVDA